MLAINWLFARSSSGPPVGRTYHPALRAARLPLPRALLALTLPTPTKRAKNTFSEIVDVVVMSCCCWLLLSSGGSL